MATGGLLHAIQFARNRPEPIRQASLLMVLASGVADADVLSTTLRSLASESGSPWSDRILHLVLLLEQGYSLSKAAGTVESLLPEETIIAIRIAEEAGNLEAALSGEAARLLSRTAQPPGSSLMTSIATLLSVLIVMIGIVSFLMVYIIPKFRMIFEDFGMELPPMTQALIEMSDSAFGLSLLLWMPTVAGLFGLCAFGWKVQLELLSQGRSHWLDWRARHRTPMVLRMLSLTTAMGCTLGEGLRSALAEMVPSRIATQLSKVRHDISSGSDLPSALHVNGFITRRESWFLEAATRTRHLDWAMRHLAANIDRRRQVWKERVSMTIPPFMILAIGAVVCFVVTAMFLPLVWMVNNLPQVTDS